MKGFIVHPTYKVEGNTAHVLLSGRLENGESFLIKNQFRPYFFMRKKDVQTALGLARFDYEETDFINFAKEDVVRVLVNIPKDVPPLKRELVNISTYESDIRFPYRYMIDRDVKGGLQIPKEYEDKYEKGERIDRVYTNVPIEPVDVFHPELTTLSIDIETDVKATNIYCISLVCGSYKEVFMVTPDKKLKNVHACDTEKELLQKFREKVLELDPDIITGWNFIDFDFQIIKKRMKDCKVPFDFGRIPDFATDIRIQTSFFQDSKLQVPGRMALDGIHLLKNNFVKLEDYKLETAARELLGKGKLMHGSGRFEEIQKAYEEDQQKLADYNLLDSQLVIEILEKEGLIDLTIQRSFLTGMQMDRVSGAVASLDSLYLRESKNIKVVCPSVHIGDEEERIKGGFVMDPKPGIYDQVLVLDFKSLYPSVMRTFNIDPISFDKHGTIEAPNGARFLNNDAILPKIITTLMKDREQAKRDKNKTASHAIKITMNSIFGVLANPACRFYNLDIANGITSFGRHIIQHTAKLLRDKGYEVIYGDTDSIFIDAKADTGEEAEKIGTQIQKEMNAYWKNHVQKEFKRESHLELEFEKVFERFILPKLRHGEGGAKKRYAGLRIHKGKESLEFTGLEFVRRDWTELAKQFQVELFNRIFHKKEVTQYVKEYVQDLKAGKLDELCMYRKAIRKPLEEYTKTSPPHVKAARKLKTKPKSKIIDYYITTDGPEPKEMLSHPIDYDHYIEKQLKPIADTILTFFGTNFEDLIKGTSQTTLFGY